MFIKPSTIHSHWKVLCKQFEFFSHRKSSQKDKGKSTTILPMIAKPRKTISKLLRTPSANNVTNSNIQTLALTFVSKPNLTIQKRRYLLSESHQKFQTTLQQHQMTPASFAQKYYYIGNYH